MSERGGLIPSRYFEPRDGLHLDPDEIVVIACVRNELLRLPYFLQYYRELGIDRFLIIDNDSDDGTGEYLTGQADVEYFHTDTSYNGSAAGRMWVQELAETYATGHWVLHVDVDELLVYPGVERFGIHDFCRYLDTQGFEGLFTVMLDCYSDVPLDQTSYESGTDFRETCPFFEVDSYRLTPADYPPFLNVWRGPRGRLEAPGDGKPKNAFLQRKVPLVKWNRGFSFVIAAHDVRYVPLADTTGSLLHFKYFSTWFGRMIADHARGDRKSTSYAFYKERIDRDLCFYGSHSRRYRSSRDLVRLGVIAAPPALRQFYAAELRARGEDPAGMNHLVPDSLPAEGGFTLRSIAAVWPFVNNPHVARYFGQLPPPQRQRVLQDTSKGVDVVDVWADRIVLRLGQRALHDWYSSGLALEVSVDDTVLDRAVLDDTATTLEVETGALIPNMYRWNVDVAGAVAADAECARVEVRLVDVSTPAAGDESRASAIRIFSGQWQRRRASTHELTEYRGDVERLAAGELSGWVFDTEARNFGVPVAVYLDGRLASFARPTVPRPGLATKLGCPRPAGRGFQVRLPIGYFRDGGLDTVRVEVRIAGLNVDLGRSPFDLPTDTDALEWDRERGWIVPMPQGREPARTGDRPPGRHATGGGSGREVAAGPRRLASTLVAVARSARHRASPASDGVNAGRR